MFGTSIHVSIRISCIAPLAHYLREEVGIKADVVKTSFGEDEE